jgi:glycosyltransferase involved in cell wall biosynthesis
VHAHSSWAGVYVRVALRRSQELSLVYTPHGYSFQRQDLPGVARAVFRVAEWILSFNTTMVAACGQHEARLSEWPLKHPSISVVPNVSHESGPMADSGQTAGDGKARSDGPGAADPGVLEAPVVVGVGRLCNAKDPTFFAESIRELRASEPSVRAVWIGEGDDHYARDLVDAGVEITGWLSADETWRVLSGSTVYLHTARWEGFPLSVLEAASAGLPIIGRDIGALRDEGLPLLFSEPREIVDIWTRLGDDDERRAARAFARRFAESHSDARQADALRVMYRGLPSVSSRASVGGGRR